MTKAERHQRLWAAFVCGSLALFISYVVWSRQPGLRVPPAVGYLAAAVFLAAGATLLLQVRGAQRAQQVTSFLLVAALAGIGGWIGFGPGNRECEGSLEFLSSMQGESVCRGVFGAGAVLTGVIAVLILRPLFGNKADRANRAAADARPPGSSNPPSTGRSA